MQLQTFAAQDANGNVQTSPTVYIYTLGTQNPISGLEDVNGDPLSNPFTGNADGRIVVAAPTGTYDMRVVKGSFDSTQVVQFIDLADQVAEATTQVGLATTQANNAASSATASAASAAAAAEIVNISEVQTFTNPLQPAPRVAMTAAASGSRGWLVRDSVEVNFGTGDFTLHWEGSLPDWTPDSVTVLLSKRRSSPLTGYIFSVDTTGKLRFLLSNTAGTALLANVLSTEAIPDSGSEKAKISAVITRETASSAGSLVFYYNGIQLGDAIAISAAAATSIDITNGFYVCGSDSVRYKSQTTAALTYNRALSAPEVLSLCKYGVDPADVGGRRAAAWTWAQGGVETFTTSGTDITSAINSSGAGTIRVQNPLGEPFFPGVQYEFSFNITINSGSVTARVHTTFDLSVAPDVIATIASSGKQKILFSPDVESQWIGFTSPSQFNISASDFYIGRLGATLHLSAQDAQSNTGQVFDSSGNGNHALLPSSGATVLPRLSGEGKHRGTTVRAATSELQYIGGTNQNVVPADVEIISWRAKATTSAAFNLGNGTSATAYGSAVTIGTTWTDVTPTGGAEVVTTALKLTETPTASYTGSVQHQIVYRRLES